MAVSILGDCFDSVAKRNRGLGATVAVHLTVGSVVLQPSAGKMYVATGRAPVSQNDFVELPLDARFDPEAFATEKFETIPAGESTLREPAMKSAVQGFIRAKMAYEYDSDVQTAYEIMKQVVATDPGNAAYHFMVAAFAMKLGKLGEAMPVLSDILAMDHTPQLQDLAQLSTAAGLRAQREPRLGSGRSATASSKARTRTRS